MCSARTNQNVSTVVPSSVEDLCTLRKRDSCFHYFKTDVLSASSFWMAAVESKDDSASSELSESLHAKDSKVSSSPNQTASWLVGDVVWSKIPGHPWWPSMVSYDPNTAVSFKYKGRARFYHVQFFGQDPVRGWVAERSILKFEGRQNFENSLHGKQLKIAQKRISLWESAVSVAEKAKPMNRHERQLCYTFKYYDKNETKKIDPFKVKKLNGFSSVPGSATLAEHVNGVDSSHQERTCDSNNSETPVSEPVAITGAESYSDSLKCAQKKTVKEKLPRKRKLGSSSGTAKSPRDLVESSKNVEPPKKKKKRTLKGSKELNLSESDLVGNDTKEAMKANLSDKHFSEIDKKCNGLYNTPDATPPRINGDVSSFIDAMEVSPNTALKLKIRKITPKQNQAEGKRKRGRPRKPRFVIVSEDGNENEGASQQVLPMDVESNEISNVQAKSTLFTETNAEDIPKKKKRIPKPTKKMLNAKESALLPSKDMPILKGKKKLAPKSECVAKTKEKIEVSNAKLKSPKGKVPSKSEKVKNVEDKKSEVSTAETSVPAVETEGSVTSSTDDTGSIKNGTVSKREKDGVCIVCEQQENLIFCEGICGNSFHLDCIGLSVVPKGKFVCDECVTGNHCCFVCRQAGNVKQCSQPMCTKYYHDECVKTYKTAKFDGDRFFCPLHFCTTCVSNKSVVSRGRLIRCVRCPTAYHISGCLVAGCIPICSNLMVCSKHFIRDKNKAHHTHVNVNWCFVCSIGGTLICCESCPAAFHPECISYEGIPEGHFFCKDCAEGKHLLYGDIVWVKLGMYRWWPAQICNPRDVPTNIQNMRHQPGEFPVQFLGSHDYYWIHRGRVFSYQEGDKGSSDSGNNKNLAKVFKKALAEAKEKYAEWRTLQESKAEQDLQKMSKKPAPYKQIKVNKCTTAVRIVIDPSELPMCDCSASNESPCGPESNCLNRMLQFECYPQRCPGKENCQNQRFQKRQYVDCEPFRTLHRGWGLRCKEDVKKGQFVIEYVGELIDDATCQERVQKGEDITNYYMLTIDKDCIIDAGPMGNLSRFMNHSCDPNCETQKWTVNGEVRVGLFASREIMAGEELTFDYQLDCLGNEKKKCHCGAKNCSSFLGVRPKNQVQEDKAKKTGDKRKKKRIKKTVVKEDLRLSSDHRKRPPPLPAVQPEACNELGTSCNTADQALKLTGTSPLNSALPWTYSPLQPGLTISNSA
ncbi:PREDICTED: histone-lysine N-methyltransferase NSD2-like isoform X2 [Acropora digitifera]|uniref:histone-lysine N-methyltransferase NSD2-like isoform X2 n=1 Tax=Acropora digitifera TaxID=70779 RepID=UPI00077A3BC2|nr:PREDICTED: histone-lysine N-methyltransferase NSD2-like isoform X2 [Acropora digitifera]